MATACCVGGEVRTNEGHFLYRRRDGLQMSKGVLQPSQTGKHHGGANRGTCTTYVNRLTFGFFCSKHSRVPSNAKIVYQEKRKKRQKAEAMPRRWEAE